MALPPRWRLAAPLRPESQAQPPLPSTPPLLLGPRLAAPAAAVVHRSMGRAGTGQGRCQVLSLTVELSGSCHMRACVHALPRPQGGWRRGSSQRPSAAALLALAVMLSTSSTSHSTLRRMHSSWQQWRRLRPQRQRQRRRRQLPSRLAGERPLRRQPGATRGRSSGVCSRGRGSMRVGWDSPPYVLLLWPPGTNQQVTVEGGVTSRFSAPHRSPWRSGSSSCAASSRTQRLPGSTRAQSWSQGCLG